MKKGVLFIILLLFSVTFISAGYNQFCNPDNNPNIHGVYIPGAEPDPCFDCGDADGLCPTDYGVFTCGDVEDPDCELVEEAFWSSDGSNKVNELEFTPDVTSIFMVIQNPSLIGIEGLVSFTVREFDEGLLGFDDIVNVDNEITGTVSEGKVIGEWKVTHEEWNEVDKGVTKFWFEADSSGGNLDSDDYFSFGVINLTAVYGELDDQIISCSDYKDGANCTDDNESIGFFDRNPEDPDNLGCALNHTVSCLWNKIVRAHF